MNCVQNVEWIVSLLWLNFYASIKSDSFALFLCENGEKNAKKENRTQFRANYGIYLYLSWKLVSGFVRFVEHMRTEGKEREKNITQN